VPLFEIPQDSIETIESLWNRCTKAEIFWYIYWHPSPVMVL
jgi:hypothetical protein